MEKEKLLKLTKAIEKYFGLEFGIFKAEEIADPEWWDMTSYQGWDQLFSDPPDNVTVDGYPDMTSHPEAIDPYVTVKLDTRDILRPRIIFDFIDIHDSDANLIEGRIIYDPGHPILVDMEIMEFMDAMTLVNELPVNDDSKKGDIIHLTAGDGHDYEWDFDTDWRIEKLSKRK
jgi:hypothetical protein